MPSVLRATFGPSAPTPAPSTVRPAPLPTVVIGEVDDAQEHGSIGALVTLRAHSFEVLPVFGPAPQGPRRFATRVELPDGFLASSMASPPRALFAGRHLGVIAAAFANFVATSINAAAGSRVLLAAHFGMLLVLETAPLVGAGRPAGHVVASPVVQAAMLGAVMGQACRTLRQVLCR